MKPCPPEAMPVVEILRRDVPRPKRLPKIRKIPVSIVGPDVHRLRWKDCLCPLALHPRLHGHSPMCEEAEQAFDSALPARVFFAFMRWWDKLTEADAKAAVDFIWPKRERRELCRRRNEETRKHD